MRHTFNRLARDGMRMYQTASHYGSMADRSIRTAAYLYRQAIPRALRDGGVNTQKADRFMKNIYDHYELYSNAVQSEINIVDGVAANLRGGSFSYP